MVKHKRDPLWENRPLNFISKSGSSS